MNIPGLGDLVLDDSACHRSRPIPLALLDGGECTIVVEGLDRDPQPEDFEQAIAALLTWSFDQLRAAQSDIFSYYQYVTADSDDGDDPVQIDAAAEVWRYVQLGKELIVSRRASGDRGIYFSLCCACDWEQEHGLQIVLNSRGRVVKIGPYDGHVSNADAYGDPRLEHVVYR